MLETTETANILEPQDLQGQWQKVCLGLEKQLSDRFAMRWISKLVPQERADNTVALLAPSPCIQELIRQNYGETLLKEWQTCDPTVEKVELRLNKPMPVISNLSVAPQQEIPLVKEKEEPYFPTLYTANLDENCTFDSFVVGKPNEFAYAAAKRVAEDDRVSFNPLYFHSAPGLGKTHLMQAIAWRTRELYPDKTVLYLSAEQFVNQYVKALRAHTMYDFQEMFRSVDVLMIDDVQFICGKNASQEEFFHTFNALVSQGKQIVLSADTSPADLQGIDERLKTRLAHGLVVDIHPTSYELRLGILQEKARAWHADVPKDVICFLAEHITASVRELEGALKRLIAHTELMGGTLDLATTKMVLKDILGTYERKVSVEEIQKVVADFYGLKLMDLKSVHRERRIARPRQLAMYLSKTMTTLSLPEIALKFDRDHTTILHAVRTIEGLLSSDKELEEDMRLIKVRLQ